DYYCYSADNSGHGFF
nr:immunoglobulin light chain junction region [Macaca mulatta]MOW05209.1 immunoglobulin light chain junction region [Macaca mulatta]MOW07796.1 immunoglobulin light chain junction region [Macaca mulatta]MOW66617.1 immunoglobulin light chain junction region [Macaca mulatta]